MRITLVRVLALCGLLSLTLPAAAPAHQAQPQAAPATKALNLNTATLDQLEALPGIGRKTAQLIVEYRTKSGGFKKVEELMNVKGIGEKSFLKLKPLVAVPPKPDKAGGD